MGGERCAAHTDDTGILHDLHHFLHGQRIGIGGSLDLFADGVLEIVFDHHGHHVAAHGIGPRLNGLHGAGNAGMDGGAQPLEFADLLADLHLIAHLNNGGAGCAKVHRHGDDHGGWGCQLLDGLFIGCGLHVMGMNAAKESLCHCLHLILTPLVDAKIPPVPPLGKWHGRASLGRLPHTEPDFTPQIKKCPDCELNFYREFVKLLAFSPVSPNYFA